MVEPLRHRQTKGAATDMFSLQPPRYISTLPNSDQNIAAPRLVAMGQERTHAPQQMTCVANMTLRRCILTRLR
jgi:hypothetical protein